MKRGVMLLVLVWAVVSTAIAIYTFSEMNKLKEELTNIQNANDTTKDLQIKSLESMLEFYRSKNSELMGRCDSLKKLLKRKNYTIAQLESKLTEFTKIPLNYYDSYFPKHNNTLTELKDFISTLKVPSNLTPYEKIAYLEWALRNAGFNAHIVYGEVEYKKTEDEKMWVVCFLKNTSYYVDIIDNELVLLNASEEEHEINGKEVEYEPLNVFTDIYSVVNLYGVDKFAWWRVVEFPQT